MILAVLHLHDNSSAKVSVQSTNSSQTRSALIHGPSAEHANSFSLHPSVGWENYGTTSEWIRKKNLLENVSYKRVQTCVQQHLDSMVW